MESRISKRSIAAFKENIARPPAQDESLTAQEKKSGKRKAESAHRKRVSRWKSLFVWFYMQLSTNGVKVGTRLDDIRGLWDAETGKRKNQQKLEEEANAWLVANRMKKPPKVH